MAPRVEIAHLGDVAVITEIFFRCFPGIVAAASLVWIIRPEHLPQDDDVRPWHERWPVARKGQDKEKLKEFFTGMADQHDTIMGKRPHVYLELVFVDPSHHRHGLASAVLQYASNLADTLVHPSYLDADQDVMPLYVKHGYVACSDVQPTSPMLAMLRPPKNVSSA
ncbi:hypothetical protein BN1723_016597 [Verticillium longisporum]|uniref:N-acetyltransferase domain-containing protein n=1 Tax=Verticillium longisporum TaxID=100787 RepID=A0A0G4NHJ4_VERLO|nr:hypothetical protein BN1723_016597 [Verticillium longisporum]